MLKINAKHNTILILLLYYDRPNMVRNALYSLVLADKYYKNWILAVNDDASSIPAEPIVKEILADKLDRIKFYRLNMTLEEKIQSGGIMGAGMNKIIQETEADIGIMLCDDDALHPYYLEGLNWYFLANPEVNSCHSKIIEYCPLRETFFNAMNRRMNPNFWLNVHKIPICGAGKVDASQVAWRLKCNKKFGAWFASPCPKNHDMYFYEELAKRSGLTHPTKLISQYKAFHDKQLGNIDHNWAWRNSSQLDTLVYPIDLPVENDPIYKTVHVNAFF